MKKLFGYIKTARNIPKNIGYSLIYIESIIYRFFTKLIKKNKRVLIMRIDHLGDCILFYPTLGTYRKFYADSEITLVMPGEFKSFSSLLSKDVADNVIYFEKKFNSSFLYRRRILLKLAMQNFDILIYPTYTRETIGYFIMKIIGAKESIGFNGDMTEHGKKLIQLGALPFTELIDTPKDIVSEIKRNLYFTQAITGIETELKFPTINIGKLSSEKYYSIAKENNLNELKYAVIFPGAGANFRIWQSENFAETIDYIYSKNIIPVICGGSTEDYLALEIIKKSKFASKIINLAGKTDLPTLSHIIVNSQFYFGSETGILHLAVAIGKPAIGIVGMGGLDRFFPYGDLMKNRFISDKTKKYVTGYWSDAYLLKPGEIHESIKNITVDDAKKEIDYIIKYINDNN